jgi:hypothetical protein
MIRLREEDCQEAQLEKEQTLKYNMHIYMSEKDCKFICSRGILKSCDVYKDPPVSSSTYLPDLGKIQENSTVYVCTTAIPNLLKNMDKIKHRFILVTGDADEEVFEHVFESEEDFITFIENDKIVHWFVQNCVSVHKKITNLPIGLDYHTLASKTTSWGEQKSPVEQEKQLMELKRTAKSFDQRDKKCYINFSAPPASYHYSYDRASALKDIPENLCKKEKESENRYTCWKNQTEYAFVVSPFGNGMDCHRTWEALALGCIPIVTASGMDPMFEGLPVLIVNNWSEVTGELLEDTVAKFKAMTFDYDKLKLQYWVNKINSYKQQENFIGHMSNKQSFLYDWFFCIIFISGLILLSLICIKNFRRYLLWVGLGLKKYSYSKTPI